MYDYSCPQCGREVHLAACFEKREMAYRALDLLGWTPVKSQWLCPECNRTPAPEIEPLTRSR